MAVLHPCSHHSFLSVLFISSLTPSRQKCLVGNIQMKVVSFRCIKMSSVTLGSILHTLYASMVYNNMLYGSYIHSSVELCMFCLEQLELCFSEHFSSVCRSRARGTDDVHCSSKV